LLAIFGLRLCLQFQQRARGRGACNISFIRPGKLDESADCDGAGNFADRTFRDYDIRVTVDDTAIAEMRDIPAHRRRMGAAGTDSQVE